MTRQALLFASLLVLASSSSAQTVSGQHPDRTTAQLGGTAAANAGKIFNHTQGLNATDCSAGGGVFQVPCWSNGTSYVALTSSGAGGSPGGADTQIQFNNAGAFGGSAFLAWDGSDFIPAGAGAQSTKVGGISTTSGTRDTCYGYACHSSHNYGSCLGSYCRAGGEAPGYASALGHNARATQKYATALGAGVLADQDGCIALGVNSAGSIANCTAADQLVTSGNLFTMAAQGSDPATCAIGDSYVHSGGERKTCTATNTWSDVVSHPRGYLFEADWAGTNAITVVTAGTFYGWTTAGSRDLDGFTADTADVTADHLTASTGSAGSYAIAMEVNFSGTLSAVVECYIFDTGVQTDIGIVRKLGVGGDVGDSGDSGQYTVADADEFSIRCTSDGNGDLINIYKFSILMHRIGL